MLPIRLAWKNLWRNRRQTLITLVAISFGVMLAQTHVNLTYGFFVTMIDNGVRAGSGHLTILHRDYMKNQDQDLVFSSKELISELNKIDEIADIFPRVRLSALVQSSQDSRGGMLVGIDDREFRVNPYLKELPAEAQLRPDVADDAVVGSQLAKELGLRIGSKFVITIQDHNGNMASELFRIRGILKSGLRNIDRHLVVVNRQQAAELRGWKNVAHEVAIILAHQKAQPGVIEKTNKLLKARPELKIYDWRETMPGMAHAMLLNDGIQSFELVLLLIILTIGIVNTLLMSVMERIREFGVMKAIGASSGWLVNLIFTEAMLLGVTGMLTGSIFGTILTYYFNQYGLDLTPIFPNNMEFGGVIYKPVIYAKWSIAEMIRLGSYIMMLSAFASVYPAFKILKSRPVDALKET